MNLRRAWSMVLLALVAACETARAPAPPPARASGAAEPTREPVVAEAPPPPPPPPAPPPVDSGEIRVLGERVFVSDFGRGVLAEYDVPTGRLTPLVRANELIPGVPVVTLGALAVTRDRLAFAVHHNYDARMFVARLDGSSPELVWQGRGSIWASAFAADGSLVFTDREGGPLRRATFAPLRVETLATFDHPAEVVVHARDVFVNVWSRGEIARVPLTGGPVTVLASGQTTPMGLTVAAGRVVWGVHTGFQVRSVALAGGEVATEFESPGCAVSDVVVDGRAFVVLCYGGIVMRAGRGEAPAQTRELSGRNNALALDAERVFAYSAAEARVRATERAR